jgi:hypothetical protein
MSIKAYHKTVLLGVFATLCFPSEARACRMVVPKDVELAGFEGVVVVSVQSSTRLEHVGWNTWSIESSRARTIAGTQSQRHYTFSTTQSSDGCGITPLPKKGDKWIVYLDASMPTTVVRAFPLSLAREHDPRLARVR